MANAAEKPARTAADVLGGDKVVQAMRSAQKVEVFRLKDQSIQRTLDDYQATAGPLAVDAKVAAELAATLTRYDSFNREVALGCEPQFGMRTRFVSKDATVDVVYCFACSILVVYYDGEKVGDGYFGPAQKQLVAAAKRMLPDDKVIQGLK